MLPRRGVLFPIWSASVLLPTLCAWAESPASKHAFDPARDEPAVEIEEVVVSATRTREGIFQVRDLFWPSKSRKYLFPMFIHQQTFSNLHIVSK